MADVAMVVPRSAPEHRADIDVGQIQQVELDHLVEDETQFDVGEQTGPAGLAQHSMRGVAPLNDGDIAFDDHGRCSRSVGNQATETSATAATTLTRWSFVAADHAVAADEFTIGNEAVVAGHITLGRERGNEHLDHAPDDDRGVRESYLNC